MDRLSVMRAFCRIVERGSFARAAEDLDVSPAMLSRDLKLLEKHLGCALLARTTRRMSLTEHGRLYYAHVQRILADITQTEDEMRGAAGRISGPLSVNAPHSFGVTVLSPLLPAFLARHPEIELTLSFDDRVVDLIEGGHDLVIRARSSLPDSALIARELAPVRQALFAAPAHLSRHGTPQTPRDLASHPAVAYLHADDASAWTLQGPEGMVTVAHHARLKVGSSLVLRDLVAAGHGIGALPDFLSKPAVSAGRLVRVLPQLELPARHVYAVTASRRGADAKVSAFVEYLRRVLTSD
ncbi:MAG: LysR substrate-binding domain-containing protein [Piscinibacter sp.]|uniref:LysR family transcriptional regulator n=1 Tax=Piscinibacter sp. TaxID=1903157 RepID=UPI003D103A1F